MAKLCPLSTPTKGGSRTSGEAHWGFNELRSTACGTATRNRSTRPEKKRDSPVVPPKSEVEPVPSEPGRGGGFSRPTVSRMKLLVEVNVVVDVLLDPVARAESSAAMWPLARPGSRWGSSPPRGDHDLQSDENRGRPKPVFGVGASTATLLTRRCEVLADFEGCRGAMSGV